MTNISIYDVPVSVRKAIKEYFSKLPLVRLSTYQNPHFLVLEKILTKKNLSHLLEDKAELVYICMKDIYSKPSCYCGKPCKFINNSTGFREYCSVKCRANDPKWQVEVKETNLEKYGCTNVSQIPEIVKKKKDSYLNRTGYTWSNAPEQRQKASEMMKNFHTENPSYIAKARKTNSIDKYGSVEAGNAIISQKTKQTIIERYGSLEELYVERAKKSKNTCLEKYGVENVSQVPEIFEKASKGGYKAKKKGIHSIRGFEDRALEYLEEKFGVDETAFITSQKVFPIKVWYQLDSKTKRYFPDIYCKHNDTVYEVKSWYTWFLDHEKNHAKLKACSLKVKTILLMIKKDGSVQEFEDFSSPELLIENKKND